jgi:hypothetical protein
VLTQASDVKPAQAVGTSPDEIHEQSRLALPLPDRPAIAEASLYK